MELDKKNYDKKVYAQIESFFIKGELSTNQVYPDLDYKFNFKKLKSAKETNLMSFTPYLKNCHFLIDNITLELLKPFSIQGYKAYEVSVSDPSTQNLNSSYRLFYSVLQDWNVIDFEKTLFTSGGFGNNPIIEHKFKDENEMKAFKGIPKVKILALQKHFDKTLDFFHTRLGGLFVSEKLKLELEEKKITGVLFNNEVEVLI